jgi:hypothetical protein
MPDDKHGTGICVHLLDSDVPQQLQPEVHK